jgi:hypothetical protein
MVISAEMIEQADASVIKDILKGEINAGGIRAFIVGDPCAPLPIVCAYGVWQDDWEDQTLIGLYWDESDAERVAVNHNAPLAALRESDIVGYEHACYKVREHEIT